MTPTLEQQAIIDESLASSDSLLINALAGSAKTTTLDMICRALPMQPILSLAFNRRIADEMKKRLPGHVLAATMNSIGHKTWAAAVGKRLVLDKDKSYNLLKEHISSLPKGARYAVQANFVENLFAIRQAKIQGYIPASLQKEGLISEADFFDSQEDEVNAATINNVLCSSIRAAFAGNIDFDDQIFMPTLFGGSFPKFPVVCIDEAQDLSGINHAMLEKIAVSSRLIAVGDPFQSIYAFRGAVSSSMSRLQARFACKEMILSISFRCPRAVVRHAQRRVPHMQAWEHAEEGEVRDLPAWKIPEIPDDAAIICRNNAPLFKLALKLLRNSRSVRLVGTDMGPQLIRALKKMGAEDDKQSIVLKNIEIWENEAITKGKSPGATHDRAECLRVFARFGANLAEAVAYADHLFKSQGSIQLLSGHKAKGLEWNTVYHLDPWRIPSKYAEGPEEIEQEKNVDYVITTRSRRSLFHVNLEDLR